MFSYRGDVTVITEKMASNILDGDTLGEKHRKYNKKLNDLLSTNFEENTTAISYNDCDIKNIFKIDIACRQKNVDFTLEVFKSRDMLYVSRAIKNAIWLIKEPKYAHIVDPAFLHHNLLPFMRMKAYNKLMLHIRLNLRDEERVDKFYTYFEVIDLQKAFKWLPHSSPALIEKVVRQYGKIIPIYIMKRLNKKSDFLFSYCKDIINLDSYNDTENAKNILSSNHSKYVDLLILIREYEIPKLSASKTKKIMKKCPEKIIDNISKFINKVHVKTLAKHIPSNKINDFLIKHSQDPYLKPLFKYDKLKYFVRHLPEQNKIDLIKTVFIDKQEIQYTSDDDLYNNTMVRCLTNMNNDYLWYEFMPYDIAFVDLKRLIEAESHPVKRCVKLCLLLTCAHGNKEHIQDVLKYYNTNHINEAYRYKARFVQQLITKEKTFYFEYTSWNFLNNIFYSMEIYKQSKNNVDNYVDCIILYNIINCNDVPDIIISKFQFKTFESLQKELNEEENIRLFEFLMEWNLSRLKQYNIVDEQDFNGIIQSLINISDLFWDWKKNLDNYPVALANVNEIIAFLVNQSRIDDLKKIHAIGKCLRRQIFNNAFLISLTDYDCIYALKHGPHLPSEQVENICKNSELPRRRFLQKLRVYWHDTLATNFRDTYLKFLSENFENGANIIGNIMTLSSQSELDELLQKYLEVGYKLDCKQNDKVKLWKGITSNLHLCRPQPSLDIMLSYTNNVTLPHTSTGVNFLLNDLNYYEMQHFVSKFCNLITRLQKLAVRYAFIKLKHDEIIKLFHEAWFTTKNRSIRVLIFKLTYSLLCSSKSHRVTEDVWALMAILIEDLGLNEHKAIYETLCNIDKCPMLIRRPYYKKVEKFLKTIQDDTYYKKFDYQLHIDDPCMNEILDLNIILVKKSAEIKNLKIKRCYPYWLPIFLMDTKCEKSQMERYDAIFVPFLDYVLQTWDKSCQESPAKANFLNIMERLYNFAGSNLLNNESVIPISMFSDIQERIQKALPKDENYLLILTIKLSVCYLKVLGSYVNVYSNKSVISRKACEEFGRICINQLNEDIKKYSPSIYLVFSQGLDDLLRKLDLDLTDKMYILEGIMSSDSAECYYIAVELMPRHVFSIDEFNSRRKLMDKIRSHPSDTIRMYLHNYFLRV